MKNKDPKKIEFVSAIHLFYDDYDASTAQLEKIEPEAIKNNKPINSKTTSKPTKSIKGTLTVKPKPIKPKSTPQHNLL